MAFDFKNSFIDATKSVIVSKAKNCILNSSLCFVIEFKKIIEPSLRNLKLNGYTISVNATSYFVFNSNGNFNFVV